MHNIFAWINPRRLRDYPRLLFFVFSVLALVNVIFHKGWQGGVRGIIGFDFTVFYSSGLLYWNDVQDLYDFTKQSQLQQNLIAPTSLGGSGNPFLYPPYVAFAFSFLTLLPYLWSYITWTFFSILAVIIAARILVLVFIPQKFQYFGFTPFQLTIVCFSFFPTFLGLLNGDSHTFTLLLVSGIIAFSWKNHRIPAGILAGLLIYKPQFVIGYIIIWVIQRHWREFFAFISVAIGYAGVVILTHGISPYLNYLNAIPTMLNIPLGVSQDAEVTPNAFLASLFGQSSIQYLRVFTIVLVVCASVSLCWYAYRTRNRSIRDQSFVYILATLYPLIVSPHILVYDLVVLIPVFVLWFAHSSLKSKSEALASYHNLIITVICVYIGVFLLLIVAQLSKLALLATIPTVLLILIIKDMISYENQYKLELMSTSSEAS